MTYQCFLGLTTTPFTHASEFLSHTWSNRGCASCRDAHQDQRGLCSSRSQFRGWTNNERLCGGAAASIGVRVGTRPSRVPGAVHTAKDEGIKPKQLAAPYSRVAKRSYRRALRRAARDGYAWYRGHYIAVKREFVPLVPSSGAPNRTNRRLGVTCWNCSGLSLELKAELFHWLHTQRHVGVVLLQETHWSYTGEWKHDGWCIFHSAAKKPKQGGLLTAIRAELVEEHCLSWKEVIPGRLTQVRCVISRQQIDILNLYQHAWSSKSSEQTQELVKQRSRLWKELDSLLQSLPLRSELILGGDFNTVLAARSGVSGFGIFPGSKLPVNSCLMSFSTIASRH